MYTLIPLTLLLLWNGLDSNMLQSPEMADILSKARVLCPHNSLCEEPPLSTATLASGNIPCCTDCSCRPDCNLRNDCCFPARGSLTITSDCLYPVSPQKGSKMLAGASRYHMVVDVTTCQTRFPVISSDHTFTEDNGTNIKIKPEEVNGKCGKCKCNIDIEKHSYDKCICDRHSVNENDDNCTCGEVQVAPWGSLFPVYSRSSNLIFKNAVCAACNGITDGVLWIPFVTCPTNSLHFIERILHDDTCSVAFISLKTLDSSRFPKCAVETRNTCLGQVLPVPHGINMTIDETRSACNTNFTSPYSGRYRNVFCSICSGSFLKKICVDDSGIKFGKTSLTLLLTSEFAEETLTKRDDKKQSVACSKSKPSDCRKLLYPSGQVRYANGVCNYPMTATYIEGFRFMIRLYPNTQASIQEMIDLLPGKKIDKGNLITPWPNTWLKISILLETIRLISSGDVENTTAVIVAVALTNPGSDLPLVLESVKYVLKEQCFIKVNNVTFALKSEFLEHISPTYNSEGNGMVPSGLTYENEMNVSAPNWIVQWGMKYPPVKKFLQITKLHFCEQVMLNSNEYILTAGKSILYEKLQGKFLYSAEFVYDAEGDENVRVCLHDTDFIKVVPSSQPSLQSAVVCVMLSTPCFLIFYL